MFRYIDTGSSAGAMNMAIDEALFNLAHEPVLRVYRWKKPTLTVGRNERKWKTINIPLCRANGIPIIRRITGGKAVLHDKELTYSIIFPDSTPYLSDKISASYLQIAKALSWTLETLGLNPKMHQRPPRDAQTFCYTSPGWYELLINGKKICGNAQKRSGPKVLQHGSILLDFDADINARIFGIPKSGITALHKKITSINAERPNPVRAETLAEKLREGFSAIFGGEFKTDRLTEEEQKAAETLEKNKYLRQSWNEIPG